MKAEPPRLTVISGSSGAGKSVVLHTLEDAGYYCIDNLPISLLAQLPAHITQGARGGDQEGDHRPERVAIGIDVRSSLGRISALQQQMDALQAAGLDTEIIFLDAADEVLTKRFSETRRKHPLSSATVALAEAISEERRVLEGISAIADLTIDTSSTSVHELRQRIRELIVRGTAGSLAMQLLSFGFKHGTPRDADFIFDVRCLPNPHWYPTPTAVIRPG